MTPSTPPTPREPVEEDPRRREQPPHRRRAERRVLALLLVAAAAGWAFVGFYAFHDDTQWLGGMLGLAFACLAAASIIASKAIVPQVVEVEERQQLLHPDEVDAVADKLGEAGEGVTRRRAIVATAGMAGAAVGAALIAPVASTGPRLDGTIHRTPWRRGRRLVDTEQRPYLAAEIEEGTFYTALPEGDRGDSFGAPLIVVRLPPAELKLPPARDDWAPYGILAYSKTCPHAGCAVSMYRHPRFRPDSRRPALVCPCHYSTFDPAQGGKLLFGPAGRNLPQLPLLVDAQGYLRAADRFREDVGPSWWGTRRAP